MRALEHTPSMQDEPPRPRSRWTYVLGTALLAGVAGAAFAALAARALGLSTAIAAATSGGLLAVIVGVLTYKYGERGPDA